MINDLLNATIHALQSGLTSIPISGALDNTETWRQKLLQSDDAGLQDIGREVTHLQSLLTSGMLNPETIGNSLSILGSQTLQAAAHADEELKAGLRSLGDLLLQTSAKLTAA